LECEAAVELVTIQFPDPHFKTRHHKRRVVQSALVRAVAEGLTPGARVFCQSDVLEVSEDMRDKFERFGAHLFTLDADLHDVSAMDPGALATNAAAAAAVARGALVADERAKANREAAGVAGYPGRRRQRGEKVDQRPQQGDAAVAVEEDGDEDTEVAAAVAEAEAGAGHEDGSRWISAWATAGPTGRGGWLDVNPLGVPTEREVQTTSTGERCYRMMLVRNNTPV
jgi:tRNA (guanine-N7-)-methyltransferase